MTTEKSLPPGAASPGAATEMLPGIPFPVPTGTRISPHLVVHNAERVFAHQALGTRIVGLQRNGVTLKLEPADHLVGDPDTGVPMNGVVATLLDHVTGLSMVAALDGQGQPGGTLELRVDYMGAAARGETLMVQGVCQRITPTVVFLIGRAWPASRPQELIATAAVTYAVDPAPRMPIGSDAPSTEIALPDIQRHDAAPLPLAQPFAQLVARTRATRDFTTLARSIPYLAFLGVTVHERDGALDVKLPGWEQHIGNYHSRHLHGGVIAAVLEAAAQLQLLADGMEGVPTAVSFTTEFLRGAVLDNLHARAIVLRRGRRFASVRCEAWQHDSKRVVAIGHGTFRAPDEGSEPR